MNVIRLPQILADEPDLEALNLSLRMGEVALDWSQVREVSQDQLTLLLAGLDLVEHSDIIGVATVPDDLTEVVLQALSQAANKPQRPYDHKHSANNNATPTVWEPEEKADLHTDTQQNEDTQHRPATEPLPTPPRSILQPLSPSAMRDKLERLVLQDLLGPAGGPGEELDEGSVRDRTFRDAHMQWRRARRLDPPELGYPGLRYVLLHSFAMPSCVN